VQVTQQTPPGVSGRSPGFTTRRAMPRTPASAAMPSRVAAAPAAFATPRRRGVTPQAAAPTPAVRSDGTADVAGTRAAGMPQDHGHPSADQAAVQRPPPANRSLRARYGGSPGPHRSSPSTDSQVR